MEVPIMALEGGCLCGGVRYEIGGKVESAANCHCSMCRKQTGSAFFSAVPVATKNLRWSKGQDLITRYDSSPGGVRLFCKKCGSTLGGGSSDPKADTFYLAMGTLDGDPGIKPSVHVYVGSKAPWYDITDKLPQFEEFPG
jgi:hypothetical protein